MDDGRSHVMPSRAKCRPPSPGALPGGPRAGRTAARLRDTVLVLVGLVSLTAFLFWPLYAANPRQSTFSIPMVGNLQVVAQSDLVYEAWLVGRHARTFVEDPTRIYEGEHCAPYERSVTYCIPMLTMGVLGIPAMLATGEPVLTYNVVLMMMTVIAGLAMYWLVTDLTGSALAGAVAAVLYAFSPVRLGSIIHPSVWDTSWTVLALFFARRLFADGRWSQALGLAVAAAFLLGTDIYPVVTSLLIVIPVGVCLLWNYGFRTVRLGQVLAVAAVTAAVAAAVFLPYLETQRLESGFRRDLHLFTTWADYLPYGQLFPGLITVLLAGVAFLPGRILASTRASFDLRWALVVAVCLTAAVSVGPHLFVLGSQHPGGVRLGSAGTAGLYDVLSHLLPGLDAIRGVFRLGAGVYLCASILAGIGTARLLAVVPRRTAAGALLLALAVGSVTWPDRIGLQSPTGWFPTAVTTEPLVVEFFAELEARHNTGAVLELPIDEPDSLSYIAFAAPRVMATFHHRRRTSACFGSYTPQARTGLVALAKQLPSADAVRDVRGLGFTTVVVHEPAVGPHNADRMRFDRASTEDSGVRKIFETPERAAYELSPVVK